MEAIKDIFKNIMQSSSDRMSSPIVGTFVISFIVYNWRAFLIIPFSDLKIEERINIIDKTYCNSNALIIPLYLTLFYIIILPHLQLGLDFILSFSQKRSDKIKKEKKIKILTDKISEASLEREIADSRAGTSEINNLKSQVDLLKEQNEDLFKKSNLELQSFNNQISELTNNYDISQKLVENFKSEANNYKDAYTKLNSNPGLVILPQEIIQILESFDYKEQESFMKLAEDNFKSANKNPNLIVKAINLGMLESNLDKGNLNEKLTPFGIIALKYIKDNILPF